MKYVIYNILKQQKDMLGLVYQYIFATVPNRYLILLYNCLEQQGLIFVIADAAVQLVLIFY